MRLLPLILLLAAAAAAGSLVSGQQSSYVSTVLTGGSPSTAQCYGPSKITKDLPGGLLFVSCQGSGILAVNGTTVTTLIAESQCPLATDVFVDSSIVPARIYASCIGVQVNSLPSVFSVRADGSSLSTVVLRSQCWARNAWVTPGGVAYLTCGPTDTVLAVNGASVAALADSTQCPSPTAIFADPARNIVYASCASPIGASSIVGSVVTPLSSLVACFAPKLVGQDVATGMIYVSCNDGAGDVFAVQNSVATRIATSAQCVFASLAVKDSSTGIIFLACGGTGPSVVAVGAGGTASIIVNSEQCRSPSTLFMDSLLGVLYAGCSSVRTSQSVAAISGATATSIASSSQCSYPAGIVEDASTGLVSVSCTGSLAFISGSSVRSVTLPTEGYYGTCSGILIGGDSVGQRYAACVDSGQLTIVAADNSASTLIPTGGRCTSVGSVYHDPRSGFIYIACLLIGQVLAVNGSSSTILSLGDECSYPSSLVRDTQRGILYLACGFYDYRGMLYTYVASLDSSGVFSKILTTTQCPLENGRQSLFVEPTSGLLYAACGDAGVITIDTSGAITTILSGTQCPSARSVFRDSVTSVLYASCVGGSAAILALSDSSITTIATSSQCSYPVAIWKGITSGIVYAACNGNVVDTVMAFSFNFRCVGGTYWSNGQCLSCPPGSSRRVQLASAEPMLTCQPCAIGSIAPAVGTPLCAPCPAGRYGDDTRVACTSCAPGSFGNQTMQSSCYECPVGRFSTSPGATTCSTCAENTVAELPGASYCTVCPAGSSVGVSSASDALHCVACAAGSSSGGGGVPCSACMAGTFSNVTGTSMCAACGVGLFALANATACTACSVGFYTPRTGSAECLVCLPGQFQNATGQSSCHDCVAGFFSSQASSTICNTCASGTISAARSSFCENCPAGTSAVLGSATSCVPCHVGSFSGGGGQGCATCAAGSASNVTGASTCSACDAGSFALANSTACSLCDVGAYSALSANAACILCLPGFYQPSRGSSGCLKCAEHTHSSGGASVCEQCALGSLAPAGSAFCIACLPGTAPAPTGEVCTLCPVGRASGDGTACQSCAAGEVAMTPGSAFCSQCAPGSTPKANAATGILECSACPAGRASLNGAPCSVCQPGFYTDAASSFSCLACTAGSASNVTALGNACGACPAGTFQSSAAQTSCLQCPPRHYSTVNGSISCQLCSAQISADRTSCNLNACPVNHLYSDDDGMCHPCPLGTAGSGLCTTCDSGYYTPAEGDSCVRCEQAGLLCSGGLASVESGYWAYLSAPDASGRQLYQTAVCPPGFCSGSPLQLSNSSMQQSISYCAFPRLNSPDNVLCAQCQEGYIEWGDGCSACSGVNVPLAVGAVLLSLGEVIFLLATGADSAGLVSVLAYFVQIAALEIGAVAQWLSWLRVVNLGSSSTTSCLANWTPYQQVLYSLLTPFFMLIELSVIALIHYALRTCVALQVDEAPSMGEAQEIAPAAALSRCQKMTVAAKAALQAACAAFSRVVSSFSWSFYVGGAMSVLLFGYVQVTQSAVGYLNCVSVGSHSVLFTAPTVDCHSPEYRAYLAPVVIMLVCYTAGLPLGILVWLWARSNVRKLAYANALAAAQKSASAAVTSPGTSTPSAGDLHAAHQFLVRYGPAYAMFERRAWYWNALVLARRMAFVVASVQLVQVPGLRFMTFALLHFASLLVHLLTRPYAATRLNNLEVLCYSALIVVSVVLTGWLPPYPLGVQVAVFLLVVPLAVVLVSMVLWEELLIHAVQKICSRRKLMQEPSPAEQQEIELRSPSQAGAVALALAIAPPTRGAAAAAASPHGPASPSAVGNQLGQRQADHRLVHVRESAISDSFEPTQAFEREVTSGRGMER